jgi:hypothetical protein
VTNEEDSTNGVVPLAFAPSRFWLVKFREKSGFKKNQGEKFLKAFFSGREDAVALKINNFFLRTPTLARLYTNYYFF